MPTLPKDFIKNLLQNPNILSDVTPLSHAPSETITAGINTTIATPSFASYTSIPEISNQSALPDHSMLHTSDNTAIMDIDTNHRLLDDPDSEIVEEGENDFDDDGSDDDTCLDLSGGVRKV